MSLILFNSCHVDSHADFIPLTVHQNVSGEPDSPEAIAERITGQSNNLGYGLGCALRKLFATAPDSAPAVYSMNEFHRIGNKPDGLSQGGLYQNALGEKWFLKMVDPRWPFVAIRATVATYLARFFLGENAPTPILVKNNHDLLTGSSQIKGYEELRKMPKPVISNECRSDYLQDDLISHQINGKLITNYQNVVSFGSFVCDSDFLINIGLVPQQNHYVTAKVDYDGAFAYGSGCADDPMNDMDQWFNKHFPGNSLDCHGIQNLKHAVDRIANTPWETINSLILNATQSVEEAISKTSKAYYHDELDIFKSRTIKKIKVRHDRFRELSSKMSYQKTQRDYRPTRRKFHK